MEPLPYLQEVEMIHLSRDIPHASYSELCVAMGYSYNWNQAVLANHRGNYNEAMTEILIKWNTEQADTSHSRMILATKLHAVNLGGLGKKLSKGGYLPQQQYPREQEATPLQSSSGDSPFREMTAHTGPSTSAGIPLQDASADGAGFSPKASEHVHLGISEMELHDLAEKLGNHTDLLKLALRLGFPYERWQRYKASSTSRDGRICIEGTLDMLIDWKKNTPQVSQKALLNDALKYAGFAEFAGDEVTPTENRAQKRTHSPEVLTDAHLLIISKELLPDHFSDLYVALGIQSSIAQGILTRKMNDYPQTYMELLQLWKTESHRTLRDLDQVLVESGAGDLISMYKQEKRPFHDEMDTSITDEELLDRSGNVPSADYHSLEDTDTNEGKDEQLTSLQRDLGSNRDDISYGGLSAPPEILARGPRAQRAYAEAAKAGKKKVFRTRLMLVGQERVGKTSLKKTLTRQGFDKNEAITDGVETTDGCEISIEVANAGGKMWSIHKKEDEYVKALADDIAKRLTVTPSQNKEGEPHSRGLNTKDAEDEMAKRLTVTQQQDQESLEPHSDTALGSGLNPLADAKEKGDKMPHQIASLVTKVLKEQVHQKDQESLEPHSDTALGSGLNPLADAKEKGDKMPHQIASLLTKVLKEQVHQKEIGTEGVSLSIWDFAGHDIYYSTHQVFLTWRAIYVIVFDLSRRLDEVVPPESRDKNYKMVKGGAKSELTCLEFINFWLYSIYAHAVAPSSVITKNMSKPDQESPPIFIVGTHRESLKGDAQEKKDQIDSAFKEIRESIIGKPFQRHVVCRYFAIENSLEDEDEELVTLRRRIERVAMKERYMGEEIPLRWLLFEEVLAAHEISYMSLDQIDCKKLMQQIGMESKSELLTMLTFYHDLGNVVYYGGIKDKQSLLRDMVILNPKWLIDVFKQVITILDSQKRDGIVCDAWNTLEKDGILEDRLIQHMWQSFLEKKEALVELMAKFDLICEAPVERRQQEQHDGVDTKVSSETEKVVRYYVPSRLTSPCPPEEIAKITSSSTDFYVDFKGFLPDGLFHRLMSRAVKWMSERHGKPVKLFHRHISLMVDEVHNALIEMLPPCEATIKVIVYRGAVDHAGDSNKLPAPSVVKEVMDFVTETLDSLIQHWARKIKYDVLFLCPSCSKKKLLKDCFKETSLQCGLNSIPTAAIKFKFGSIDSRKSSSLKRNEDASRAVESTQGSVPSYQTSRSATSGSSQGQPKFYDIYLTFSQDTDDVHKVKDIIRRNGWTMMTADDGTLGVPKMTSIEGALETCSHVVVIITKEDCEKKDPYQTMTMGMAFHSTVGGSLDGRVIPIRCCEERHLPLQLRSLKNACINDHYLEDNLKRTIDVSIRKNKEGSSVG